MRWDEFIRIPLNLLYEMGEVAILRSNEEANFEASLHGREITKPDKIKKTATPTEINKAINLGMDLWQQKSS